MFGWISPNSTTLDLDRPGIFESWLMKKCIALVFWHGSSQPIPTIFRNPPWFHWPISASPWLSFPSSSQGLDGHLQVLDVICNTSLVPNQPWINVPNGCLIGRVHLKVSDNDSIGGVTPPINKPWFINPGLTLWFRVIFVGLGSGIIHKTPWFRSRRKCRVAIVPSSTPVKFETRKLADHFVSIRRRIPEFWATPSASEWSFA